MSGLDLSIDERTLLSIYFSFRPIDGFSQGKYSLFLKGVLLSRLTEMKRINEMDRNQVLFRPLLRLYRLDNLLY